MGLIQDKVIFLMGVILTAFSLSLVYMVEKVNIGVRELWDTQRGARGSGLPEGSGQGPAGGAHHTAPSGNRAARGQPQPWASGTAWGWVEPWP